MKSTVIFSHKCGQLGNRLFAFAHFIANAAENKYALINLSFDEYAQYFETSCFDVFCRYPSSKSLITSNRLRSGLFQLNRVGLKLLRVSSFTKSHWHEVIIADMPEYQFYTGKYYNLNEQSFQKIVHAKKWTILFGRFFRDYVSIVKHKSVIRDFFRPNQLIQRNVSEFLKNVRNDLEVIVGVHIRRGDYQQYSEGKYFYSQKEYYKKMLELQSNEPEKKFSFIICSNENVDPNQFEGLHCLIGPSHLVEDMYIFAGCDFLMGPPSTYTRWASFYGNVPLLQLQDLAIPVRLKDFVMLPPEKLFDF